MDTIYEEDGTNNHQNTTPSNRRILQPHYRNRQQQPEPIAKSPNAPAASDKLTAAFVERVENRVDCLEVIRVLGEGAFGEVVLVVDKNDHTIAAAMKRVCLRGLNEDIGKAVRKEALLQRAAKGHPNVLKYLTMRINSDIFELYLEYADGGELFDQIEPDYGMEPARAQYYYRQLINGLQYIHAAGIVHRDIKPENLLLTRNNILKISDFGMATVFCHNGVRRTLSTRCGTMPYAAPEILLGPYHGEPIDVWSSGIVLVTMLVGELPWGAPRRDCYEFTSFMEGEAMQNRPWCRLDTVELSILSMIFTENPGKRATIPRIKKHPWFIGELGFFTDWKRKIPPSSPGFNRAAKVPRLLEHIPSSQPAFMRSLKDKDALVLTNSSKPRQPLPMMSFSQPHRVDDLILNRSQVSASQFANYSHPIASLVRRMTRFCVDLPVEDAIKAVEQACKKTDCEFRQSTSHQIQITCIKHEELSFFATIYEMVDGGIQKVLVDFRLSKGDGLEFKRKFMEFKELMSKVICKHSSSWLEKQGVLCRRPAREIVAAANENIARVRAAEV